MGLLVDTDLGSSRRFKDDGIPTKSSIVQKEIEDAVYGLYEQYFPLGEESLAKTGIKLYREKHIKYLVKNLNSLPYFMVALDASKPWLLYWIFHALDILDAQLPESMLERGIESISQWQVPSGGFAGGSDQIPHLATTYAAVSALAVIGTKEAYDIIDRKSLYDFLLCMKQSDGSFTMHEGGEVDIRGSYCALSVAAMLNILTPELTHKASDFICRAQTYEGGIGPYPGKEAHNGYTFCALAAMEILGSLHQVDMHKLLSWCCERQMLLEGGFQGRTNKLVDGCYSFWGAGDFPLLAAELQRQGRPAADYLFDREALQEYLLICCQDKAGGMLDKPGKYRDFYHTCYCLSGLSTAQHTVSYDICAAEAFQARGIDLSCNGLRSLLWSYKGVSSIVGDVSNCIKPIHPVHNVSLTKARAIIHYFYSDQVENIRELLPVDNSA